MNPLYDHEALTAIVQEARRQGFDDKIIALRLHIARDDAAFGFGGEDQLRASISEYLRRGIHYEGIAERLGLSLSELVRIEGNPDLCISMYGDVRCVNPDSAHSEKGILRLIELGRASFRRTNGSAVLRQLSRNESLVLLVDELGFEGARKLIARFVHVCGGGDAAANGLHIPKVAPFAVTIGSFPTTDVEQMRDSDTVH